MKPLKCSCGICKLCVNRVHQRTYIEKKRAAGLIISIPRREGCRCSLPGCSACHQRKYRLKKARLEPGFCSDEELEQRLVKYFIYKGWETEEWIRTDADNIRRARLLEFVGKDIDSQDVLSNDVESIGSGRIKIRETYQETKVSYASIQRMFFIPEGRKCGATLEHSKLLSS